MKFACRTQDSCPNAEVSDAVPKCLQDNKVGLYGCSSPRDGLLNVMWTSLASTVVDLSVKAKIKGSVIIERLIYEQILAP